VPRALLVDWRFNLHYFYGRNFRDVPGHHTRWCEKTPSNVLHFDRLLELFGGKARFIHIIRDGRDVVLSRHPEDETRYWVEPERWIREVRKGLSLKDHEKVHTLKYEDLILNYDREARAICEFLNLDDIDPIIDWHRNTTVKENRAWSGEVKPIFGDSVGKWKDPKHADRLAEFMADPEAVELLRELGYDD
jgi:hypothetical protein